MSDWAFLNKHRIRRGQFASGDEFGFNGAFTFALPGEARKIMVIASDTHGFQHVSVSFGQNHKTPSWEIMCAVKDLFWDSEDTVVQLHPPKSKWISNHPGALHLWRCTDGREQPMPPEWMVGIPGVESKEIEKAVDAGLMFHVEQPVAR